MFKTKQEIVENNKNCIGIMVGGTPKPFACTYEGCNMAFTNEDHLNVHQKKHEMVLNLGNKANIVVADQTPTPTRFLRNCEEVGLFQDLQNVNPFDETFRRAAELVKTGSLPEPDLPEDDTLHTPHVFPHLPEENVTGIYTSQNCNNIKDDKLSLHTNDNTIERNIDLSVETISPEAHVNDKELNTIENVKLLQSNKSSLLLSTENLNKIHDHGYSIFNESKSKEESKAILKQNLNLNNKKIIYLKNQKLIKEVVNNKDTLGSLTTKFKLQQALLKNKKLLESNNYNSSILLKPIITITPADKILQSNSSLSLVNTTIPVLQKIQKAQILPKVGFVNVNQKPTQHQPETKPITRIAKNISNNAGDKKKEMLERNRAAAIRCREKKKLWIENLSNKYETVCQENSNLVKENTALRNEVMQLKTLLLAHKECSVTKAMSMGQNISIGPAQILHVEVQSETCKAVKNNSSEPLKPEKEAKIAKLNTKTLPKIVKDVTFTKNKSKTSVIVINNTYNNLNS